MKKEGKILELFFNEPSKHWHFEEILNEAKISRPQAVVWLKKMVKEELVKRIKKRGKMPYYVGYCENPAYQARKRIFALTEFERIGFLSHLNSLPKAKAIILFGSMSRWDWYKDSDIDIFIYGDSEGLKRGEYWRKLRREIEVFVCKDHAELCKFPIGLLKNVIEGYLVKGTLDFVKVEVAHA
ncbi:nucleotidyltransferase domain-containing protein [Candidatus Woesearchaeota archaeon]|nr:nucleotidyltransferase domain-containing protein [Candidatus Woesearchaeota archaeon]